MKYVLFLVLGGVVGVLAVLLGAVSQAPLVATPTPILVRSLFEDDTCAPPCWFGLIPGQSTSRDIVGMVQAHSDIFVREEEFATGTFYPHTELLIDGYYSFYLRHGNPRNVFVIREGVLSWMRVALNKGISLHRILEAFGQPNDVYTTIGLYNMILILFYRDVNMFVTLVADREDCNLLQISVHYMGEYLFYYSPESFQELRAALYLRDVEVPQHIWEAWLNGEVSGFCEDVINQLYGIPDTATQTKIERPTPTPTATQLARTTQAATATAIRLGK